MSHDAELARLRAILPSHLQLLHALGRGGFAAVYAAEDTRLHRRVAIKVLHEELDSALHRDRFRREMEIVAGLRHPHIIAIYEVSVAPEGMWYTMPLITGASLRRRLDDGPLAIEEAQRVLVQVASALHAAHEAGLLHRDVKPDNILLDEESGTAILTDFGIAKLTGEGEGARLTATGMLLGTPQYMSPEQLASDTVVDRRSDIYALGVVAYQALTGALPFDGPSLPILIAKTLSEEPVPLAWRRPDCPTPLADAVMRCLAKSPEDRWETAAEFLRALTDGRPRGGPQTARRSSRNVPEDIRAEQLRRIRRSLLRAGALYAIAFAAVAALEWYWGFLFLTPLLPVIAAAHLGTSLSRAWVEGFEPREIRSGVPAPAAGGPAEPEMSSLEGSVAQLLRTVRTERRIIGAMVHRLPRNALARQPGLLDRLATAVQEAEAAALRIADIDQRLTELRALRRATGTTPWDEPLSRHTEADVAAQLRGERQQLLRGLQQCADALRALRLRTQQDGLERAGDALEAVSLATRELRSSDTALAAR